MNKEETLQSCVVEGLVVKLPAGQLDRKVYLEVAKALELIGGKWKGGKVMGFVFPSDPTELLEQIANGEKRNLKKEFQFFATPDDIADWLVELADINEDDEILEPSAGQGAIVNAINRVLPNKDVYCFELMDVNRTFLNKIPTAKLLGDDFLTTGIKAPCITKIIANPPFSKNQDIDHVYQMFKYFLLGGRMVSVMSKHWQNSTNKKETQFREWLKLVNAEVHEIEGGKFKSSGTNIATCVVVINKA